MEVLILNWKDIKNPQKGGAEIIAFELAKRLVLEGHQVTFFCRAYPSSIPQENIDGIHINRKGGKYTVYFHAYRYYKKLVRKPDKVLDMINTIGWMTPLYIPKSKRFAYLNQLAKRVWFYEFPFLFACLGYLLECLEYVLYRSTPVIVYSKSTKNDLIKLGIPAINIRFFPIGIDVEKYQRGVKSRIPLFIFVARLVSMKRADICIQALAILINQYPLIKLAIIGNGPEQTQLEKLCRTLHLEKHIEFVDKNNFYLHKNTKDLKVSYMQKAWAILLPSIKEGWGLVVTEAGACGTPAIVSGVTGLIDSVDNLNTGIVLSTYPTVQELADAMKMIIDNPSIRKELSDNAFQLNKKFTWDKSYSEFKKIILS